MKNKKTVDGLVSYFLRALENVDQADTWMSFHVRRLKMASIYFTNDVQNQPHDSEVILYVLQRFESFP